MDVREKLVELLCSNSLHRDGVTMYDVADHLIANGVTVQDNTEISDEFLKMLKTAHLTILQEEPTIEVVQEWISVKDRLPEAHRLVLCRWTRGIGASYGFARYQHEIDVWYVSNEGMPEVTHWMPLPQPPKGE